MCNNVASHPLLALKATCSLAIIFLVSKNQASLVDMTRSIILQIHGSKGIGRCVPMKDVFLVFGMCTTMASFQV